ncbi:hypothetical protein SAMN05421799_10131 [Alicyclobacillus vulcanalis]|uniref:Uncharacterized protein n=1 Tax=Alicyclobacillus vulcanalis TaxID=252246 RepID=A0A1N7JKL6_9BACL|nr:hypothetical protein SAMN05421799_10131 [Alicyclobacillus vulcanalis]
MSRRHRALMARQEDDHWGWPVIGGIGLGLGAMLICMPQSRNAMFHAVEHAFDRSRNGTQGSFAPSRRHGSYGP